MGCLIKGHSNFNKLYHGINSLCGSLTRLGGRILFRPLAACIIIAAVGQAPFNVHYVFVFIGLLLFWRNGGGGIKVSSAWEGAIVTGKT